MRILHSSDWHLGQYFYGKSRADEHNAFIDWLLEQISTHQVDALIVAGDLFDTGTPPSYARAIYNRLVTAMLKLDCQLVLLGGNHDSVSMLEESQQLLHALDTHLVAKAQPNPEQQLVEIHDNNQQLIGIVCAVPYLRPRDVQTSVANQDAAAKQRGLQQAIAEHYQRLHQAALERKGNRNIPIVTTGHLTAVGASRSESVRDLYIGTLEAFPASGFPAADYVALGHIHRSQTIGGSDHIRYSGSPIPLSFDELGQAKQVLLVDFDQDAKAEVTPLTVPCFQPMATLKGSLAEVEQQLSQFSDSDHSIWLDIEIRSDDYLSDLQGRVSALCEPYPVEPLLIRRQRQQSRDSLSQQQQNETLQELNASDVFERRLALEPFDDEQGQQRKTRLQQLFNQTLSQLEEQQ